MSDCSLFTRTKRACSSMDTLLIKTVVHRLPKTHVRCLKFPYIRQNRFLVCIVLKPNCGATVLSTGLGCWGGGGGGVHNQNLPLINTNTVTFLLSLQK